MFDNKKYRIALFASGSGSNAEKITHYFTSHPSVEVGLMLCNKKEAGVFDRMSKFPQVVSRYLNNKDFRDGETVLELLSEHHIDFIVLAGFLLKIPENLIKAYPKRIINIPKLNCIFKFNLNFFIYRHHARCGCFNYSYVGNEWI